MPRPNEIAADARALYGPVTSRPDAADMGDGALWVDPGAGHALYQVQSGNWVTISPGEAGGTVTSVGLSTSGLLHSVSGSPVTGSGTLSLDLKTQVHNTVLAGPGSGADAVPTMRALVAADVPSLDASAIGSGTLALDRLSGITTAQLNAAAAITSAQISALDAAKITSGTLPLARLSGITHSELDAAAGIVSGQIASVNPSALTGSGTVPLAGLAGITTTQLSSTAGIVSGQIAGLDGSKITGSNTLADSALSTNVPLLNASNTFSAVQIISGTVNGVLAQISNTSTTGGGLVIGNTAVLSAGSGKIAPALAVTQTQPATANYGLVSIGPAAWDGSSTGKFVGSTSGTILALTVASGSTANFIDMQQDSASRFKVDHSGNITCGTIAAGSTTLGALTATNNFNVLNSNPIGSANIGLLSLGAGAFSGAAAPAYQGHSAGTALAINITTTAWLADWQVSGVSKFSVDNTGALAFTPATTTTAPSAGAAGALPATPAGYMTLTVGGVARQIPYY